MTLCLSRANGQFLRTVQSTRAWVNRLMARWPVNPRDQSSGALGDAGLRLNRAVPQQHLTGISQKIIQMRLDDVDCDGQLQRLVFVHSNVSEAHHAFHGVGHFGC